MSLDNSSANVVRFYLLCKVNHALSESNLAELLILLLLCLFGKSRVARTSFAVSRCLRPPKQNLVLEGLVGDAQRRIIYSQEGQLSRHYFALESRHGVGDGDEVRISGSRGTSISQEKVRVVEMLIRA